MQRFHKLTGFRAMPNTPASIGAGMTALAGDDVHTDLGRAVQALFEAVGEVAVVSEADLDRLGALSGAGPGYMFVILDALADAGVRIGLPRHLAIKQRLKRCMVLARWLLKVAIIQQYYEIK